MSSQLFSVIYLFRFGKICSQGAKSDDGAPRERYLQQSILLFI